jgi:hypothetical protein
MRRSLRQVADVVGNDGETHTAAPAAAASTAALSARMFV